jgi:hypothetical protein
MIWLLNPGEQHIVVGIIINFTSTVIVIVITVLVFWLTVL